MIMQLSQLLPSMTMPFLVAALLIEMTPGPNMTYLALVSASEGRRAGLATVAGIALGLALLGLTAALGLTELLQASAIAYEVLRWAGVAFLLYLAWEGWTSGTDVVARASIGDGGYFSRGLITNLLNPKAGLFYVAVLPTFMNATSPPIYQAAVLTAIYVAVATFVHLVIVLLAGSLQPLLTNPKHERFTRRLLSSLLALVALWFAWTTIR